MSAGSGPMPYPPVRALEDAAFARGVTPRRLLAVLFPVWSVEVEATSTESEPYAVIDRFVARAVAEGRVTGVAELADYLCLDPVVAGRAVAYLNSIGHLTGADGALVVTDLGLRSLRDGRRYRVTDGDRRTLYFDGFTSSPLPGPYYDSRTVTLLDDAAARSVRRADQRPRFGALVSFTFDTGAVERLAADPERERFNLPESFEKPRVVSAARTVWLPLYVVRAADGDGRPRCLPYSQAGDSVADDLVAPVEASPAPALLDTETEVGGGRHGTDEKQARAWLRDRGLGRLAPARTSHGTWEVVLPTSAFEGGDGVPLDKVESYVMLGSGFLRIRCSSEEVRQRALLERMSTYLAYHPDAVAGEVQCQLDLRTRQLALAPIEVADLRRTATDAGDRVLAGKLAPLVDAA